MTAGPVLVLGGRSDIGLATVRRFAAAGHPVQLAARDAQSLTAEKQNIELRYRVPVSLLDFDVLDTSSHPAFVKALAELPEIVVCAIGLLGDQLRSERDIEAAILVQRSNYEGPASILSAFANAFEERGSGTIVGISSVAGDRGRRSNYVYGSAKAGFSAFLSGLRSRLANSGVHVVTVKPGFVKTKMVEAMDVPALLTASPDAVAEAIHGAVRKKRNVIYIKLMWFAIMLVIIHLPEFVFKRLRI